MRLNYHYDDWWQGQKEKIGCINVCRGPQKDKVLEVLYTIKATTCANDIRIFKSKTPGSFKISAATGHSSECSYVWLIYFYFYVFVAMEMNSWSSCCSVVHIPCVILMCTGCFCFWWLGVPVFFEYVRNSISLFICCFFLFHTKLKFLNLFLPLFVFFNFLYVCI